VCRRAGQLSGARGVIVRIGPGHGAAGSGPELVEERPSVEGTPGQPRALVRRRSRDANRAARGAGRAGLRDLHHQPQVAGARDLGLRNRQLDLCQRVRAGPFHLGDQVGQIEIVAGIQRQAVRLSGRIEVADVKPELGDFVVIARRGGWRRYALHQRERIAGRPEDV